MLYAYIYIYHTRTYAHAREGVRHIHHYVGDFSFGSPGCNFPLSLVIYPYFAVRDVSSKLSKSSKPHLSPGYPHPSATNYPILDSYNLHVITSVYTVSPLNVYLMRRY